MSKDNKKKSVGGGGEGMDDDLRAFITKQNDLIRKDIKEIKDTVNENEKKPKLLIDNQ